MADTNYDMTLIDTASIPNNESNGFLSGSPIYMNIISMTYQLNNNVDSKAPPNKPASPVGIVTGSEIWNYRKGQISYSGVLNPAIVIKGVIDLSILDEQYNVGSYGFTSNGHRVITPYLLWKIASYPTTWWLNDKRFFKHLENKTEIFTGTTPDTILTNEYTPMVIGSGIPISIRDLQISENVTNIITYQLTCIEDKN